MRAQEEKMTRKALVCYIVDVFLLFVGLACAVSGFVLWGLGEGGYRGGRNAAGLATGRATWETLHKLTGVAGVVGVIVHLLLHWRWLMKMSSLLFRAKAPKAPVCPPEPEERA